MLGHKGRSTEINYQSGQTFLDQEFEELPA